MNDSHNTNEELNENIDIKLSYPKTDNPFENSEKNDIPVVDTNLLNSPESFDEAPEPVLKKVGAPINEEVNETLNNSGTVTEEKKVDSNLIIVEDNKIDSVQTGADDSSMNQDLVLVQPNDDINIDSNSISENEVNNKIETTSEPTEIIQTTKEETIIEEQDNRSALDKIVGQIKKYYLYLIIGIILIIGAAQVPKLFKNNNAKLECVRASGSKLIVYFDNTGIASMVFNGSDVSSSEVDSYSINLLQKFLEAKRNSDDYIQEFKKIVAEYEETKNNATCK